MGIYCWCLTALWVENWKYEFFDAWNHEWNLDFWSNPELENMVPEEGWQKIARFQKQSISTFIPQILVRIALLSLKKSIRNKNIWFPDWKLYFWSNHELENMVPEEVWQKKLWFQKESVSRFTPQIFMKIASLSSKKLYLVEIIFFSKKKKFL